MTRMGHANSVLAKLRIVPHLTFATGTAPTMHPNRCNDERERFAWRLLKCRLLCKRRALCIVWRLHPFCGREMLLMQSALTFAATGLFIAFDECLFVGIYCRLWSGGLNFHCWKLYERLFGSRFDSILKMLECAGICGISFFVSTLKEFFFYVELYDYLIFVYVPNN